jgi:hypothetical protein
VNGAIVVARIGKRTLMERYEIADELAGVGAQELLTSTSLARLAYLGKDATPRVIPIGSSGPT